MEFSGSSVWSRQPYALDTADAERTARETAPFTLQPLRSSTASLLFIDAGVENYQQLIAGIQTGTEIHVLSSAQDAVEQITQTLLGRHGISSLHIVSHGEAGGLQLGNSWLTSATMSRYATQFRSWSAALTEDADILLYGCDVAQGEQGQAFLGQLSYFTGADIAASSDLTGDVEQGGNWILEVNTGEIGTAIAFQPEALDAYRGVLSVDLISVSDPTLFSDSVGGSSGANSVSSDGRFVVFTSSANNLVDNDINGLSDVFLFDRTNNSIKLISYKFNKTFSAKGASSNAVISSNGDFVTFISNASDLVSGDIQNSENRQNIFVWDRQNDVTTLVSRNPLGLSGNRNSSSQSISADGDTILFLSQATNLDPRDGNTQRDAYLWTRTDNKVILVDRDAAKTGVGEGGVSAAVLSSDGGYVAFTSTSGNLIPNDPDSNSSSDVFLWKRPSNPSVDDSVLLALTSGANVSGSLSISIGGDRVAFVSNNPLTGANDTNNLQDVFVWTRSTSNPTTGIIQLVSVNDLGQSGTTLNPAFGDGSFRPVLNVLGTHVAFTSTASDLDGGDTNGKKDVFVRDLEQGKTFLVNRSSSGVTGDSESDFATLSYNGKQVSFISSATNLVANDTNNKPDVFVRDITTNVTHLISRTPEGTVGNDTSGSTSITGFPTAIAPVISEDGNFVVFNSAATDLIANDGNAVEDVFITGVVVASGNAVLATRRNTGGLGNSRTGSGDSDTSFGSSVSEDGRYIVFTSTAPELAANDVNAAQDVFLRDRQTNQTTLISRNQAETGSANGISTSPQISANGRYIVFSSTASDIVANDSNNASDIFWYDRQENRMVLVSHAHNSTASADGASLNPVLSADGLYVAFVSVAQNLTSGSTNNKQNIFIWNSATDTTILVSHINGNDGGNADSDSPVISDDGGYVAFASSASDLTGNDINSKKDVFVWNRSTNAIAVVSQSSEGTASNGDSFAPSISSDGQIIAFASLATNLGGGTDNNGGQDIFARNLTNNTTTLVSVSKDNAYSIGGGELINRFGAFKPVVSGNGQFVAFSSTFSDLVSDDLNNAEDVFVRNLNDNTTQIVSITSQGSSETGTSNGASGSPGTGSSDPVISSNGRFVGFSSYSTNLVSGDTNGSQDVFVRDLSTASTLWISAGGNGASFNPVINRSGSYLAFASQAINLTSSDLNGKPDVFGSTLTTVVSLVAANKSVAESGAATAPTYEIRRSRTEGALTIALKIDPTSTATIAATLGAIADFTPTLDAGSFTISGSDLIITMPDAVGVVTLTLTPQDDIQAEAAEFVTLTLASDPTYAVSAIANTDTVIIEANDTVVTSTNDSGEGSLRQAILNANAFSGEDTISFQIPGSDVRTISLASALPDLLDAVIIDGTTQAGYIATPIIELNGEGAGNANGLTIKADNSTVKGLIINRFSQHGIRLEGTNTVVQGNYIGTDAAGDSNFGNALNGISLNSSNNTIGGTTNGSANIIANNQGSGITIEGSATGNRIQQNAIFLNAGLGIDLGNDGVTANDAGDIDTGANGLQNTAVLTIAAPSETNTAIAGTFDGAASSTFRVEFFSSNLADSSGFGEGQRFLGATTITTDNAGQAIVNYTHPEALAIGQFITATVTDANGNTSEFSNARVIAVPNITISPTTLEQLEGAEGTTTSYTFTITLDQASSQTVSVQVNTEDITASNTNDYDAVNQEITFAPGETVKTVTVNAKGDNVNEPNETFRVTLSNAVNGVLGTETSAIATILDDDNPPTIAIANITSPTVTEGDSGTTDYQFEVSLSNPTSDPVTVTYATTDGSAKASDSDYTPASQTLTFAPGETSKIVTINGIGDTKFEQDETFFVTLSNASSNASISTTSATGTIKNDDQGSIISISTLSELNEGTEGTTTDYTFTVNLDKPSGEVVTVNYRTEDGTAKASDNDYEPTTGTLTFAPNTTLQTFFVKVKGDRTFENDEQFSVILSDPTNGAISIGQGSAVATIKNDDLQPTLQIVAPNKIEGDVPNPFNFLVSLSNPTDREVTVTYATEDGTAIAGEDYTAQTNQTLTFAAGETEKTIAVTVLGDRKHEPNETFSIKLTNAANATLANGNGINAIATIQNDDPLPEITISNTTTNSLEGGIGTVNPNTFEVVLSNPSDQVITVNYDAINGNLIQGANATLEDNDFEATSGTVTFNPGETTQTIIVNVKGDEDREPDESYLVKLSNASSSATLKTDTAIGIIQNDDNPPTISILDASIDEGNSGQTALTFTVNLSSASTDPITVFYSTSDGSATVSDSDYVPVSNASITFAPGETSKQVTVFVNGDTTLEPNEDFKVTLTTPTNATILNAIATGTIKNDDLRPTLGISGVTKGEGNSGTQDYVFTVSLSNGSTEVITVDYTTQDDSATIADGDYIAKSGRLIFNPGGLLQQQITVQTIGDTKFEPTEKFIVKLLEQSVVNADISVSQADGILTNDDSQPTFSLSGRQSQNEGNSGTTPFVFEVNLSNPSSDIVTVSYTTIPGTATADVDYLSTAGTLTFNPGEQKKTITVLATGDTEVEPDEDFILRLSNPINASLPVSATDVQGIIVNDDAPPFPTISIDDASGNEGNAGTTTALTFKIRLSQATTIPVTVQYATSNGTARTDDADYTGIATTTLTFAPNEIEKDVIVLVNGDNKFEPSETFNVTLANPTNAQLSTIARQATGVIINDDAKPTLSINAIALTEGNTGLKDFVFAVDLSNPTADGVEVDYDTLDGTARLDDGDYQRSTGTLTFAPGAPLRQFITVKVVGDRIYEPTETFSVSLKNPKNADLSTVPNQGIGTILADDFRPTLSIQNAAAFEGNSATTPLLFTVELSNPSSETVTVQYDSQPGTANTSDYIRSTGVLTFAPLEQTKTIAVQIIGDTEYELDETFTVELSNPSNALLPPSGSTLSATGTIRNDDPVPQLQVSAPTSQKEGNSGIIPYVFEVSLSQASPLPITVAYTTADGQATVADNDYTPIAGTLTFAPGELKKTVAVNVLGDTRPEANETFQFKLSNPTNATIAAGSDLVDAIIENDDTAPGAQIDRDSKTDIVWRNAQTGENTIWYLNNTTYAASTNLPIMAEAGWRIRATTDLDADGDDDIVWQNVLTSAVKVWIMQGGKLAQDVTLPIVPGLSWSIVGAADFNRDRKADIIWRNTKTGENVIWLMDGSTFVNDAYFLTVPDQSWKMQQFGDFDNDGDTDILWRNDTTGENHLWQMQNTQHQASFVLPTVADLSWTIEGVGDFTGDSFLDILWRNTNTSENVIWQTSNFKFERDYWIKPVTDRGWEVERLADFNSDRNVDILWRNYLTGENVIWYMNRTNFGVGLRLPVIPDLNWNSVFVGDFNRDRAQEILFHNDQTGESMTWQLNTTLYDRAVPFVTVSDLDWVIDLTGDFDGDGEADLVWRQVRSGHMDISLMKNGAPYGSSFSTQLPDPQWVAAAAADFDGDGSLDLLWRNHRTGEIALWNMDKGNRVDSHYLMQVSDLDWKIVGVSDFNRDRKPDIVWRNHRTGQTDIWLMDGFKYNSSVSLQTVSNEWRIKGIGDFNIDNQPDLLWLNERTGETVIWVMNDTQFQFDRYLPTVSDRSWDIHAVRDFGGDGLTDLLWRNNQTGENVIWFLHGTEFGIDVYLPTYVNNNWKIEAVDDFKHTR
ncbi:Calx-beta domain-containing protein [Myxacorys almedinensis]|uniref:DUF4347 domain-containing protein n=1 Tax=Myxacorys almedinensis A TaxID=2690445 RepID=A0A8J7Z3B1_9CYAN|nr:Calx-beta domain-containing protein [Myxacorys almedinensis]NDJ17348.1 DUF4347 domain-containing protein [Myxacorys almedinensis A]